MVRQSSITLESECTEAERGFLTSTLRSSDLSGRHLEIGTAAGGTLKELIGVYSGRPTRPDFVVIDPLTYYPNQFEKVRQNLTNAGIDPDSVEFWQGVTQDFLNRERDAGGRFDFVFIDGDHRAFPVMIDLQWADTVNTGGFIFLHDRQPKFPGVGWAIDYFLENCPEFEHVGQVDSLVCLRKARDRSAPCVTRRDLRRARWKQMRLKYARSIKKRLGRKQATS